MYSILIDDKENGKQKSAAAGVKKCVKDKELHHELYRKILRGPVMINETGKNPGGSLCSSNDLQIKEPHCLHSGSV